MIVRSIAAARCDFTHDSARDTPFDADDVVM